MLLERPAIEATLAVIQRRSAPGSHLIVMYVMRSLLLPLIAFLLRGVADPLRSLFTPDQMRALLAQYGCTVVRDDGLPAIAARLSAALARDTRVMKHMRVRTAKRARHALQGPRVAI